MRTALCLLLVLCCRLHATPVTTLAFSPDDIVFVSGGDRSVDVRSAKDAALQRRIECDTPRIASLAFAPSGKLLAVGGGEPGVRGEVLLYSWPEGNLLHRIGRHHDVVTSVAFSADSTQLGAASADHTATIWSVPAEGPPAETATLRGHAGPVLALAFSPDGIITASADRSLKMWTIDGKLQRTLSQHTEPIHALAVRPGSPMCASAGDDRSVRLWQPAIGRMIRIVRQHDAPIFALAWLPDGSALFSAGQEGIIRRLDAGSDRVQASWKAHDDWIYSLAVSHDGLSVASGDWQGLVKLHSANRPGR